MKQSFPFKPFAHVVVALAALTFTQCNKPAADAPASAKPTAAAGNPVTVISEGASPTFGAVASRLELGGRSFEYSEAGGIAGFAKFMDEVMKAVPEKDRKDLPPGFSFAKVCQLLGLDAVTATGASARARADGTFHSRTFAYMPKGRKGLMTLSGGPAAKLMMLDFAPKDTDLALEFPIHLNEFGREVLPGLAELMPPADRARFEHEMSQPLPPLGMSGKQVIEKLDARIGIYLKLDPAQKFKPAPDAPEFPGADGVIVIERLGWLVEALKPQFMPMLSQPDAPVSMTDEGGVLTVRMKGPVGPPPMDFQPVARFDSKADRIIIATRPALFDSIVAGKEKITQGADFTPAWRDLPSEGNTCLYASSRLLQTVSHLIAKAAQTPSTPAADAAVIRKIFDWVRPLLSRGQALVIANQPDGILALSNTSISAGSSTMTTVSTVAILAGFALPVYQKVRVKATSSATEKHNIEVLKGLQHSLMIYAAENDGKYPVKLSELGPRYALPHHLVGFMDLRTRETIDWLYRNSLTETSPKDEILIAAPVPAQDGLRAVGFNDGSFKTIPEAEFQALWNRK